MKRIQWLVLAGVLSLGLSAMAAECCCAHGKKSAKRVTTKKAAKPVSCSMTSAACAAGAEELKLTPKEEKLAALNTAYRAGLITTRQYQKQRAETLAER